MKEEKDKEMRAKEKKLKEEKLSEANKRKEKEEKDAKRKNATSVRESVTLVEHVEEQQQAIPSSTRLLAVHPVSR